jgi:hypothetical protein
MGDRVESHRSEVIRGISKKSKKIKIHFFLFLQNSFFFKKTEITCADG